MLLYSNDDISPVILYVNPLSNTKVQIIINIYPWTSWYQNGPVSSFVESAESLLPNSRRQSVRKVFLFHDRLLLPIDFNLHNLFVLLTGNDIKQSDLEEIIQKETGGI